MQKLLNYNSSEWREREKRELQEAFWNKAYHQEGDFIQINDDNDNENAEYPFNCEKEQLLDRMIVNTKDLPFKQV